MEEKDYIYIYNEKGKKHKMELVFKIELPGNSKQYIVYKEIDNKVPLYIAKINLVQGITSIDTDISEEEKELIIRTIKKRLLEESNGL